VVSYACTELGEIQYENLETRSGWSVAHFVCSFGGCTRRRAGQKRLPQRQEEWWVSLPLIQNLKQVDAVLEAAMGPEEWGRMKIEGIAP
jgi:hypothetical protein